jgi:predicted ATPase
MAVLTDTLSQFRAEGLLHFMPFYLMLLADVLEGTGNSAAALERLEEALHLVELTKEKWYEAQLHRTKGELLKSRGSFEAAEADFVQALSVARCQNAKMWELRSAASLARFWRDQGKRDEARDLLAPVYGWFTEGFDTLDLKEAKALLDEVSS